MLEGARRWLPRTFRVRATGSPADRLEGKVGLGIAVLVPVFAIIGAVVMFSAEGPGSEARRLLCGAVLLTTLPVGGWWWVHGKDVVRMPGWFVIYADVGVAVVLFTFAERGLALHATVLFAVIGIYIAYFSNTVVLRAHSAFISIVIVVLAYGTYVEGVHDATSVIAQALVALNSVIVFRAVIKAQLDLAITDSLTGLLNRRGFETRIERLLTESADGGHVAVFVVDLDRFKSINDTRGHAAGDRVLRSTAARLESVLPEQACVARTGGEEFTAAVRLDPSDTSTVARRIRDSLHEPTDEVAVTGSVGAALVCVEKWQALDPADASEMVHSALLKADAAMYEAKRSGGNQARVFGS